MPICQSHSKLHPMFSTAPLSGSPKLPDGIPPRPLTARTCENKPGKTKSHRHSHARVPPQHLFMAFRNWLPGLQTLLGSFGLIPAPNPCLKIAVCQSCQSATSAPLYGIPKLTDGTLPRLQTLLARFGLIPAPHPCAFKWRVPAIKLFSNPPRRFGQARLPPQHLFMAFRNWRMAPCHAFKPFSAALASFLDHTLVPSSGVCPP